MKEIELEAIFKELKKDSKKIFLISFLAASVAAIFSLFIDNKYTSSALLEPKTEMDSSLLAGGSLGALTELAGVEANNSQLQKYLAIETMESMDFFEEFYNKEEFLINLMAWDNDSKNNINQSYYDPSKKLWKRSSFIFKTAKPSLEEAFRAFHKNNLSISVEKPSGFIRISVTHKSPFIAQNWTKQIVDGINARLSSRDYLEAETNIDFLKDIISTSKQTEVVKSISVLLTEELKTLMLSQTSENYFFYYIDNPRVPEEKSAPSRTVIVIGIFIIFLVLTSIVRLLRKKL